MERLSSHGEMLSRVQLEQLPHSSFDLGKHNYLSGKLGKIIPTRVSEVYPGDTLKGNTQIVANFEPLAGPIAGSMVLKQESFYVPYSVVWRNAHKFYTGKNGFNTPMPTVSPKAIYNVYQTVLRLRSILQLFDDDFFLSGNVDTPASDLLPIQTNIESFIDSLRTFGEQYQVLDLFQPIIDKYNYYFEENAVMLPGGSWTTRYGDAFSRHAEADRPLLYLLADFWEFVYTYFFGPSSMLDYMGFPVLSDWHEFFTALAEARDTSITTKRYPVSYDSLDVFSNIPLAWLTFRAAYACWYWNYRDQLLETSALDPESDDFMSDIVSSTEIILLTLLRVRCWYKDTFTTALTNTGDGNFNVPVGVQSEVAGSRDVTFYNDEGLLQGTLDAQAALEAGATIARIDVGGIQYDVPMNYLSSSLGVNGVSSATTYGNDYSLSLDLFDRIARLRRFTRKELILGYEYDDVLWASFRVRLSNVRMRIPELLARGRDTVSMNTIVNNTTTAEQIAGDKTAVAWANGNTDNVNYFVEEHGLYLHFMTIMPVQTYVGGLARLYLKKERFDMMWPEFSTMGMDAVYNAELAAPLGSGIFDGLSDVAALSVFGYQGRYYDLKSEHDEAHGRFRTDLSYMLFDRHFDMKNPPKLNYIFVHCWPRLDMFVSDAADVDHIRTIDVYSNVDAFRTLPVESERV